jgi:hypothetical protein
MALDVFKAIEMSLGINRQATQIAVGGFVVMALAIGLVQFADDDKLTFWRLLVAQVVLMVFMLMLTQLPLLARRMMAWVLTLCFSFIMVTATLQSATGNRFTPPLALSSCIISFYLADNCQTTPADTSLNALALVGAAEAQDATDPAAVPALTGAELTSAQEGARLFLQFAGYRRPEIVALADRLVRGGWRVEGADRGGERIVTAAGLNEVRYFNPADAGLAAALAASIRTAIPGKDVTVKDLSASRYGKDDTGLLEVWISE